VHAAGRRKGTQGPWQHPFDHEVVTLANLSGFDGSPESRAVYPESAPGCGHGCGRGADGEGTLRRDRPLPGGGQNARAGHMTTRSRLCGPTRRTRRNPCDSAIDAASRPGTPHTVILTLRERG
jgi:hypothetical protein